MFLRTLFYMLRQIGHMMLYLVNLRFSSASVVQRDSINLNLLLYLVMVQPVRPHDCII